MLQVCNYEIYISHISNRLMCLDVVEKDNNEILVCTPFLLIRVKAPFKIVYIMEQTIPCFAADFKEQ